MARLKWLLLLVVVALAVFVGLLWEPRLLPDSYHYLQMVDIFRGTVDVSTAQPPFCYRPLFPFLVSLSPFDEVLTWVSINIMFMIMLTITVFFTIKRFGVGDFGAFVGTGLTTVSIPTIVFTSCVVIDIPAMFFLALAMYCLLGDWIDTAPWRIVVLLVIGTLFKEIAILGGLIWMIHGHNHKKMWIRGLICTALCVGVYMTVRLLFSSIGVSGTWMWDWNNLWNFVNRPFDIIETFVFAYMFWIPAVIVAIGIIWSTGDWRGKITHQTKRWVGIGLLPFGLLVFAGTFMAYLDLRFLWPSFLALGPFVGHGADTFIKQLSTFIGGIR